MDASALNTPLTVGLMMLAALPWVVKAFQWIGQRELTRAEIANTTRDKRLADFDAINAARALADAKRDRDISDLQRSHGETLQSVKGMETTLDRRIEKSGDEHRKSVKDLEIVMRNEMMKLANSINAKAARARK